MEIALVIIILVAAVLLFVTEKYPVDMVSMLVLAALLVVWLAGHYAWIDPHRWITLEQTIGGFSNPAVLTVAAMFVLSAGFQKAGGMDVVARGFARLGRIHTVLLFVVMLTVGVVSAFVNNTAAVAVFMPVVLAVCAKYKVSASRLLIPLSFASQFGGVCTLIGTSANLLVSSISEDAGYGAFSMFEFSRMGVILLGAGILYFLLIGRWLLPARRRAQLAEAYQVREYLTELRVLEKSPLIGKTVRETKLGEQQDVTVLEILRGHHKIWSPHFEPIKPDDILLVRGKVENLMQLKRTVGLEIEPQAKLKDNALPAEELMLLEVLVAPRSRLVGRTIADLGFRWRYESIVLALQRHGHLLRDKLTNVRLQFGDALLLLIRKEDVPRMRANESFIVLQERQSPPMENRKAFLAFAIIAGVVALASTQIMPVLMSAILGCLAMILSRCITLDQAYEAVDWRVIFLLAGILPLGETLKQTGAAELFAKDALDLVGWLGPSAVLGMFYVLAALFTSVMSNNAAAVLIAPIAISSAVKLGLDPKPFLMAVTFAASTCFATPVGYQTNTMVYSAGGYRFVDFMKVGIPLNILFGGLAIYFIPKFWPF